MSLNVHNSFYNITSYAYKEYYSVYYTINQGLYDREAYTYMLRMSIMLVIRAMYSRNFENHGKQYIKSDCKKPVAYCRDYIDALALSQ